MSGFLGGRTGLVQVIDLPGEGGHRVEVCPLQVVDLLLRGGRHRSTPLQHHTHPKVPLLHLPVGIRKLFMCQLLRCFSCLNEYHL